MCIVCLQIQNTEYLASKLKNKRHFFLSDLRPVIAVKDWRFKIVGIITRETYCFFLSHWHMTYLKFYDHYCDALQTAGGDLKETVVSFFLANFYF